MNTPTTTPTPKTTAAKVASVPPVPPAIPRPEDFPDVKAKAENLARIVAECDRLKARIKDNRGEQIAEQQAGKDRAAAILRGEKVDAIRPLLEQHGALVRLLRDTETARRMAEGELAEARGKARIAAAGPLREYERQVVRAAAVQLILAAKAMQAMQRFHDQLLSADLLSLFPRPLPEQLPWGTPDDPTSWLNMVLGELVVAGHLDLKADAELLSGCKPIVPKPPAPPEPIKPREPKKVSALAKSLKKLGFAGIPNGDYWPE